MPYVPKKNREFIDCWVKQLADAIRNERTMMAPAAQLEADRMTVEAGLLNYAITTLVLNLMGTPRYWKIALLTGVLKNVDQELYRRVVVPYERRKCSENGDVYPEPES